MTNIIGLVGFKRVGKSTAAEYLAEQYGYMRHNMKDALVADIKRNFPDLLREIAGHSFREKPLFKTTEDFKLGQIVQIDTSSPTIDDLFTIKPPLMRALLQNYGTQVRRGDDNNYWVKRWKETLPEGNVVVDDVRFINEAQAIIANGGTLIRITRPDITTGGEHVSETEHLDIQCIHTIETKEGDTDALYRELDRIVAELK